MDTAGNLYQGRPFWGNTAACIGNCFPNKYPISSGSNANTWPLVGYIQGAHTANTNAQNIGIAGKAGWEAASLGLSCSIAAASASVHALPSSRCVRDQAWSHALEAIDSPPSD